MRLFDSHCHLDFAEFDADRTDVLRRARTAGVSDLLIPGYAPEQWARAADVRALGAAHEVRVHVAVGVHPFALVQEAAAVLDLPAGELMARLETAAAQYGAVAIGECGLDQGLARREGERCSLARQAAVLREHVRAATRLELPLVLHVVQAHGFALELLRETLAKARSPGRPRGVIHAFSGSPELAHEYVALGFMLAFGGAVTQPGHRRAQASARSTPDHALLVETDAPSGRLQGGPLRNEPSAVVEVTRALSVLRGTSAEHVARVTFENARACFGP